MSACHELAGPEHELKSRLNDVVKDQVSPVPLKRLKSLQWTSHVYHVSHDFWYTSKTGVNKYRSLRMLRIIHLPSYQPPHYATL